MRLKRPLLLMRGDRLIVRDPSVNSTVGGAVVSLAYLCAYATPRAAAGVFVDPAPASLPDALEALFGASAAAFDTGELELMLNVPAAELSGAVNASSEYSFAGGFTVKKARLASVKEDVVKAVTEFHGKNPLLPGPGEDAVFKAVEKRLVPGLGPQGAMGLFREMVAALAAKGVIRKDGSTLSLASRTQREELAPSEKAVMGLFSGAFASVGNEDLSTLRLDRAEVARTLASLQRRGEVVKLKEGAYITGAAASAARERLVAHLKARGSVKAAEFRDILGCGRKLAIEILEYFDKERVTLRQGDIRTLRQAP